MNFEDFAIFQKLLELLERHGISPMDISVHTFSTIENYRLEIADHAGTTADQLQKLQQLRRDLGIEDTQWAIDVEDPADVYSMLCGALEKAPKSFTRYR